MAWFTYAFVRHSASLSYPNGLRRECWEIHEMFKYAHGFVVLVWYDEVSSCGLMWCVYPYSAGQSADQAALEHTGDIAQYHNTKKHDEARTVYCNIMPSMYRFLLLVRRCKDVHHPEAMGFPNLILSPILSTLRYNMFNKIHILNISAIAS